MPPSIITRKEYQPGNPVKDAIRDYLLQQKMDVTSFIGKSILDQQRLAKTAYGYGISPELETGAAMIRDPAGTALDVASQLGERELQNSGVTGAMIPTRANLPKFLELMRKHLMNRNHGTPDTDLVQAYLKARYPKRYEKMLPIYSKAGQVHPGGNFVVDSPKNTWTTINSLADNLEEISPHGIRNTVGVLAHEGEHATQFKRPASGFTIKDFTPIEKGGTYFRLKPGFTKEDFERYSTQPIEVPAFRTTNTAKKSFNKFLDLVAPSGLIKDQFSALRQFLIDSGTK